MEIGSFIELQMPKGREYYAKYTDVARLNSGRSAIFHALKVYDCKTIWLPYYQCESVRDFLNKKNIVCKYYHIDSRFNPIDLTPMHKEAVLLVNYFGIMSDKRMKKLARRYDNVIIDNSQAFFSVPIAGCLNIYSTRKFMGVPDGAYVIGNNASSGVENYQQSYSSDTSLFLFQRIEYGCEGKAYYSRMANEKRIDEEGCMQMSKLTYSILDGTDYKNIIKKRKENFEYAHHLFKSINKIDAKLYFDSSCVPMVYPLLIEDGNLYERLIASKHFQGHWWNYLLKEVAENSFEYWISKYMVPITIDQRYSIRDIERIAAVVFGEKK